MSNLPNSIERDETIPEGLRVLTDVYAGLSDEEIAEIEEIILDRSNFLSKPVPTIEPERDSVDLEFVGKAEFDEDEDLPENFRLALAVYDGLTDDEIQEVEEISLARCNSRSAFSAPSAV
ncbi:MAG: hypothetical protein AAF639_28080 [Chloroflexota bacterium]